MSDSLDMLLSGAARAPTMGRRAVVAPSPTSARGGSFASSAATPMSPSSAASPAYAYGRKESYSGAPSMSPVSARGGAPDYSSGYGYAPAKPSPPPSAYDKAPQSNGYGGGYDKTDYRSAQSYEQNKSSQQPQQQQQQPLSQGLSSHVNGSSSGGSVDWAAFKANKQRIGSASATVTAQQPATSFAPSNGPKSAAAGLSDQYLASRAAAQAQQQQQQQQPQSTPASSPQKEVKTDDTVISGAVIAPLKIGGPQSQQTPQASPVKRNPFASPPAGSPVAASPFATASSGLTRSNALSSPTAAAGLPEGVGVRQVVTVPCPDCGRNFKRGSLMKHAKVCKKVFGATRTQFDSSKARTQALGIEEDGEDDGEEDEEEERPYVRPTTAGMRKPLPGGKNEESKEQSSPDKGGKDTAKWKQSSEGLREAMRRAKKERAVFAQSSAMGIDMRSMMHKR